MPLVKSPLVPYPIDLVQAIADRHDLPGEVTLLPKGGMVNEAWGIGDAYILRIVGEGKDEECDSEAAREAVVVPILTKAGITTPELIAADASMEFAPRPYTIYRRAKGELLGFSARTYEDYNLAWRQIGIDLARLFAIPVDNSIKEVLHPDPGPSFEKWLKRARDRNAVSQQEADDIVMTAERASELGGAPPAPCLIHNDIHPWNLMGNPATGALTAILDWGDASLGDPARDFAMMPLPCVPPMLEGYAESSGATREQIARMAARAFVVGLNVALFEVSTPEMSEFDRRWWRMPPGGWEEMKATYLAQLPAFLEPAEPGP